MEWTVQMIGPGMHLGVVVLDGGIGYAAIGSTSRQAVLRVLEKAAEVSDEARYELGIMLGLRRRNIGTEGHWQSKRSRSAGASRDQ